LTSAFDALGDFSFTFLQSSGVHFTEVDQMIGFYSHDERFLFISGTLGLRVFAGGETPEVQNSQSDVTC
jgi:hypothetical protein